MKMSDLIAEFISEMLSDNGGIAELSRKKLASHFDCVPSQINYVISTRFTPEHGYVVESQRGDGGYIRIIRVLDSRQHSLMQVAKGIGEEMSAGEGTKLIGALVTAGLLTAGEAKILLAATSDAALNAVTSAAGRNILRANIIRFVLANG